MARVEPVRGISNNPNPKQNNTSGDQKGKNERSNTGAKGPSIFTPEGRKVYGDTEGPLPKIVVKDPAKMTLSGGISYINHPEYQGIVDKPTLGKDQLPNAEKGLMESIPTLLDPGGLVTGATNSYLVNRGLKTPAEAVLEQSIATGLGGIPIIGALAKKNPVVRNTIKQIPFSDQTVFGSIKNRLFNKPKFVEETVNGVPYNKPINVQIPRGEGTSHNITPDVMRRRICKGTQPGEIVNGNTIYKWNKDTKKYNPTNITGVDNVQRYRENELYKKLKEKGYDMSLNGPYVDGAGQLKPMAWMDKEADNFIPYLYKDTENYIHASDHSINPGSSLESKYRGTQEMWDERGGDLGFGGYVFNPNDTINGYPVTELFSPDYVRGLQGYFMDTNAPARSNFLRIDTPIKYQSDNVVNAMKKESERLGNEDYVTKAYLNEKPFGNEYMLDPKIMDNGIIHDLPRVGDMPSYLDRRYGVPGIRGADAYPQYVIGNEDYNTFIKGNKPVVNETMIEQFAYDGAWYDPVESAIKDEYGDLLLNIKPADVDLAKKRFPIGNPNINELD